MLQMGEADIVRVCGRKAFDAGLGYYRQARVVSFTRDGDRIRSRVSGTQRRPYEQTITLRSANGRTELDDVCTCPVGIHCKHVVAALLHADRIASASRSAASGADAVAPLSVPGRPAPPPEPDLPAHLLAWLADLGQAAAATEDYPDDIAGRMIYVLQPAAEGAKLPRLAVQATTAKLKKDGTWAANSRPYAGTAYPAGTPPKHLRPSDVRILRGLAQARFDYNTKLSILADEVGADLLARMLDTGRARWASIDGSVLRPGPARPGRVSWRPDGETSLVPGLDLEGGGIALAATPPVYVDPAAGLVGPIDTGHPPAVAAALFRAPPVPAAAAAVLNAKLVERNPGLTALAPPAPEVERLADIDPVPVLRLATAMLPVVPPYSRYDPRTGEYVMRELIGVARPAFRYGPIEIQAGETRAGETRAGETRAMVTRFHAGRLVEVARRPRAEAAALEALAAHGFRSLAELRPGTPREHARDLAPEGDEFAWYDAVYRTLPALRAAGWEIHVAPDFPVRLLRADGAFDAEISEGSGIDWLDLSLGISIEGERIDLVGPIVAMIAAPSFSPDVLERLAEDDDDPVYVGLPDGRTLAVPLGRLRPIVRAIHDLALGPGGGEGRLRLSLFDAAALAEFEAATAGAILAWRGGDAIRDLGRKLTAHGGVPPVAPPPGFRATLRPYQAEGVSWLSLLREVGLGGILADDMGLGKTVQALAFLTIEKAAGRLDRPALVVAPTSLMANWRREAERFAPELRVLTLHGLGRKSLFDRIAEHDLVLTTYPLIARDHEALAARPWHLLLLDEAQTIKNPDATTTRLLFKIDARHRFCLTGTPLENNLGELWSLFSFACPGLLGERRRFAAVWRNPIEKGGDGERGRALARRVRPFMLRRTKEEVARDLPPKIEIVERIELAPAQRDVYDSIRLSMHQRVRDAIAEKGWARSRIIILDALLKLRQACCDPRLLKLRSRPAAGSAKLERLEDMLEELLAEGRRVIVFSQFTSMLDLIRPRLDGARIPYALLTGQTRDRPAAIAAFQSGAARVFLISLKAGGTGLNLVEADTIVLYDPWWNPAVEAQAIDRAHRIGQTKTVFVHKLVAVDTIEQKMEILKEKKGALAASLFDHDGAPTLAMTEADIEDLLAP